MDVALNVEWQIEEELETLKDIKGISGGVGSIFPAQDLLEQGICCVTCLYTEKESELKRGEINKAPTTGTIVSARLLKKLIPYQKFEYYRSRMFFRADSVCSIVYSQSVALGNIFVSGEGQKNGCLACYGES